MAAGLLEMVANLTIGRKRYVEVWDQASRVRERAAELRQEARRLADEDVRDYATFVDALALPRSTEEEKAERKRRMQQGLKSAARAPLEVMNVASQTMELAFELVGIGNTSAISDIGTAALSARAGFRAAQLNVEINLEAVEDADWKRGMRQRVEGLPDPDVLERQVWERVRSVIRGDPR